MAVNPSPVNFGDVVSKFTTYLSSGYTGLDVYWIDEEMASTFSAAGWLEPLENHIANPDASGPYVVTVYPGHAEHPQAHAPQYGDGGLFVVADRVP
ncbi:MAG TPA: hypothetical protein VNL71_08860 [Chloroflexota bacterium]|nr:hypothetical protein [Chloroflexota bacterium]